jgi:DNA-binding transcriptional LysR family regulator
MRNAIDLKQLETLRAIAETGSFHAAAERLHVTQSAISHQIKNLENELSELLIVRGRPRVYLSEAGQLVLQSAGPILTAIAELRQRFSGTEDVERPVPLRVAASTLGIVYLHGDLLEQFITQHPRIELIVTATQTPLEGIRQVVSRAVDVAFGALPIKFKNVEIIKLGTAEHVLIVKPTHALARLRRITVDDIRGYPFIRYQVGAGSRHISNQIFLGSGGYPPIIMESNDTEFIKRIVGLGIGAAIVPSFTVVNEVNEMRFKILPLRGIRTSQEFCLVHRKDASARNLKVFRDFILRQKYRQLVLKRV